MFQLSGVHCSSFLGSLREAGEVPWGAQGRPKGLLGYILRSTPLEPPALKDLMKVLGWGSHVCFEFLALLDSSDR